MFGLFPFIAFFRDCKPAVIIFIACTFSGSEFRRSLLITRYRSASCHTATAASLEIQEYDNIQSVLHKSSIKMKAFIVSALALSLLSVAVAVKLTYFTDTACSTQAAAEINIGTGTLLNPVVADLNACVKYSNAPTYMKYTTCSDQAAYAFFSDAGCATQLSQSQAPVGTCIQMIGMTGVGSTKTTCSASSATLAIISVVASALVLCL